MSKKFINESTYKYFLNNGKENEFDKFFDEALAKVKKDFGKTHHMYIGGKEVDSDSIITERSPINKDIIIGYFQNGKREHVKIAINSAKNSFINWSNINYKERITVFRRFADILSKNKFELAAILSIENGKSRYESIGEVDEAIDFSRYYASELEINKGYIRKTFSEGSKMGVLEGFQGAPSNSEKVIIRLMPYGVFGVIAPFNFPLSISVGMSVGAMISGNCVIFKPSSTDNMTMYIGLKIYELLKEAGLPDGVFNYITGPGSEVGDELVINEEVSGIVFTGSRTVGMNMLAKVYNSKKQKVFVVEMGGKNPVIISKNSDLESAVNGVLSAAFGFSGQKCSALSRVYIHESIKEIFISRLVGKLRNLEIGDPTKKEVFIGPLISESAYKRYVDTVDKIKTAGRIIYGGSKIDTPLNGFYVEPIVAELRHEHELVHTELFLPILIVIGFREFESAIHMSNDVEYGLTAGLYSNNKKEIEEFTKKIEAGVIYINRAISATTGAIVGIHTFVGWKDSGLTGKGTGSKFYLPQFMREQSISITKED